MDVVSVLFGLFLWLIICQSGRALNYYLSSPEGEEGKKKKKSSSSSLLSLLCSLFGRFLECVSVEAAERGGPAGCPTNTVNPQRQQEWWEWEEKQGGDKNTAIPEEKRRLGPRMWVFFLFLNIKEILDLICYSCSNPRTVMVHRRIWPTFYKSLKRNYYYYYYDTMTIYGSCPRLLLFLIMLMTLMFISSISSIFTGNLAFVESLADMWPTIWKLY